ncbi:MAG: ABC-type transport auxiliary lipoprotein family protein [Pseudomonadota bacterium]
MKPFVARMLVFASVLVLSACSLGGKTVPLAVIEPQVGPLNLAGLEAVAWSVEVPRPVTDQTRDSDRVIVRRGGSRLQVYPGVSWLDGLPEMVQTLLVQALSDSARVAGVGRSGLRARFALAAELRRFELVDDGEGLRVELVVTASLIDQRASLSVGSRTFRVTQTVSSNDIDDTVTAFEGGLNTLLSELIPWMLASGESVFAMSES